VNPRSEPLLWLQLIGLGVLPLEALLLLLLLAGSDPGPLPGLERLLCWSIGALAPALLLARRPADVWSLLVLQTPLRGRRDLQQRLSRLQDTQPLRLAPAAAAVLTLPLLWWIDRHAAVATAFSPLPSSPRLVALLLAALLLALMLWQCQQLIQSLWLLSRSPEAVAAVQPLTQAELEQQRLCLGLPLLLPDPLQLPTAPEKTPLTSSPPIDKPAIPSPSAPASSPVDSEPGEAASEAGKGAGGAEREESSTVGPVRPVAVEPEQSPEDAEGSDLDQEIH
jgi:hypothetical protein